MNKFISLFVLGLAIICLSGCQTLKRTASSTGKGIADTTSKAYKKMEKTDNWMKENLW